MALAALAVFILLTTTPPALPTFAQTRIAPSSEARLLDRQGREIARRRTDSSVRRLDWVPLDRISPALVSRILASEDRRFYDHRGIDWRGVGGAIRDRFERRARAGGEYDHHAAGGVAVARIGAGRRSVVPAENHAGTDGAAAGADVVQGSDT